MLLSEKSLDPNPKKHGIFKIQKKILKIEKSHLIATTDTEVLYCIENSNHGYKIT